MTTTGKKVSKRGGARPGAGRKPKDRTPTAPIDGLTFETAESYLAAVVQGTAPADPVRVRAAATLIRYQETHKRTPKSSPTPKQLEKSEQAAADTAVIEDFETRAAEIRKRHKEKISNGNR